MQIVVTTHSDTLLAVFLNKPIRCSSVKKNWAPRVLTVLTKKDFRSGWRSTAWVNYGAKVRLGETAGETSGGGDENQTLTLCRKAFHDLVEDSCRERRKPKFIACGGRSDAFQDFRIALRETDYYSILLVDSEEPIMRNVSVWTHLENRVGDNWNKPEAANADQAHPMVQCMESWFLADKEVLAQYYGGGFLTNRLPLNPDIENVPKIDVRAALEQSTRPTQKGCHHKVRHGFAILGQLSLAKICERSPHAKAFRDLVLTKLDE